MYTKETLTAINGRFVNMGYHVIHEIDVKKANEFVDLIESTRSTVTPKSGDMLIYINKYGEYYPHAHIEKESGVGNICERASVPFISAKEDGSGIRCSASGGTWPTVYLNEMRYVGKAKKRFCFWGSCGACRDGAVEFEAEVSVWEYTDPNQETPGYTTKEYQKFYLRDSGDDTPYTRETGYRYHISTGAYNHRAFRTREDLDAWLKTFKAKVFERGDSNAIIWTWKQVDRHVSPNEFDAMGEPTDTMIFNGAVRKCKRKYDEDHHTVTTCFVWYWDEDGDFNEVAQRQNKIREEKYTLPWNTQEFIVARGGKL